MKEQRSTEGTTDGVAVMRVVIDLYGSASPDRAVGGASIAWAVDETLHNKVNKSVVLRRALNAILDDLEGLTTPA